MALPSIFVSHGAPTIAIEDGAARRFLIDFGQHLPRPRAIVMVSAHWETADVHVLNGARLDTIHDFYGFPAALYERDYPVAGAPDVAAEIGALLRDAGIPVTYDVRRGLDHGAWIPLSLMYPDGDIPVTQVSISPMRSSDFHWQLGQALAPLRERGVLLVGSGALTHNLGDWRTLRRSADGTLPTPAYAVDFCDWVAVTLERGDTESLCAWEVRAPQARRAHPSPDHFLPLHVAAGAAGAPWRGERVHASFDYGVIGMDCYVFDTPCAVAA
jgi:4,5-DOPA dioxygenase extradiol